MLAILIVEDNRFFSEALSSALQSRFPFLALAKAAGAKEALAQIQAVRPELIFMDVVLPDGNGLELTRRIRAGGINAVVAVLTSHDLPEYREEAIRSGADHFIGKASMDLGDIFALVESILATRFRALIVAEDAAFMDQISGFLLRIRPGAVIARARNWDEAMDVADALKPSLVLLRSETDPDRERSFCSRMHARCAGSEMSVVRVGDPRPEGRWACPTDYCIATAAAFSPALAAIIDSLPGAGAGRLNA